MCKRIKQFEQIIDSHFNIVKLSSLIQNALQFKINNKRQLNFQKKKSNFFLKQQKHRL